jgi:cytoskeletal protein CcmA (bactofilin family)
VFGGKPRGDAREGMTLIGEEAFFHGSLTAKGSLRVEGTFEGDITDAADVEIGVRGRILGDLAAETVVVSGEVVGNVVASRSVELLAGSRLTGDVRAPKLRIEDGAFFEGSCSMSSGEEKPHRRRAKSEAQSTPPPEPVS